MGTTVTPYLCVHDADEALRFYAEAFGAVEDLRIPYEGKVGHAEFEIDGARFMLSDEYREHLAVSPRTLGGTAVMLHLDIADVDAVVERAVSAGATLARPVSDEPHGNRVGVIVDPYGHRWMISTPIPS